MTKKDIICQECGVNIASKVETTHSRNKHQVIQCDECYRLKAVRYSRDWKRRNKKPASCKICGRDMEELDRRRLRCNQCEPEYKRGKVLEWAQKRIASKKGLPRTLTLGQWQEMLEEYNHMCVYCYSKDNLTQEHIVPVSKRGGYTKENIVPACQSCNSSKGNKSLIYWMGTR